jgi:ketosteroid isomerase-like protein
VEGRAAIAEYWQAYFEEAREGALTIESAIAIPGGFVVQWRDEFAHAPTGATVSYRGISILEVADGQVARETAYYDQATIYTQEGGTCEGPAAAKPATPATG